MSELSILVLPDERLRKEVNQTLTKEQIRSRKTQEFIRQLDVLRVAGVGVGVSAPQVGVSLPIMIIEYPRAFLKSKNSLIRKDWELEEIKKRVYVNPKVTYFHEDGERVFPELCLSCPDYWWFVRRCRRIKIDALNGQGDPISHELVGWGARIVQHEYDHFFGKLICDQDEKFCVSEYEVCNKWKHTCHEEIQQYVWNLR